MLKKHPLFYDIHFKMLWPTQLTDVKVGQNIV